MYLDECHLHTHPHQAKVWQRRGARQSVPAAGVDQRVTVFGALDYRTGQLVTEIAERASSATFQAFIASLVPLWPHDHLVLVMDNASYHKAAALRHWAMTQTPEVTLLWLPTYSPHLNLIERVWRFVKQRLACHRFWNDLPSLIAFATQLMDRTQATFAAPTNPHIQSVHNF